MDNSYKDDSWMFWYNYYKKNVSELRYLYTFLKEKVESLNYVVKIGSIDSDSKSYSDRLKEIGAITQLIKEKMEE